MQRLIIEGVDVTHSRLVSLTNLADQAKPFYDWVETQFQIALLQSATLDQILMTGSIDQIKIGIKACYNASKTANLPLFFDGLGRSYPHVKACYYFFAWIIRDAPQQRLAPLVRRIVRASRKTRNEVEIDTIAALIYEYRNNVRTFAWESVREVIIDRLEGSRRSITGRQRETVVRTALLTAIQSYFAQYANYGKFAKVEIPEGQVIIGNESFDVSANLINTEGDCLQKVLIPVKTRETEGGGHSNLFTRDIMSAVNTVKVNNTNDYIAVVIVARNWSNTSIESIHEKVDHYVVFDISPNDFIEFSDDEQIKLNSFIASVLSGSISPKQYNE